MTWIGNRPIPTTGLRSRDGIIKIAGDPVMTRRFRRDVP